MIDRRRLLAAATAFAAAPTLATAADDDLDAVLSEIDAGLRSRDPAGAAVGAARLARVDPQGLSPLRRLEQAAVLGGLRREASLTEGDYAGRLRLALGKAIGPKAAHRRAMAEGETLQQRADALLRGQGLRQGSVAERLRAFARDERFLYADTAAGRDLAIAEMNRALARLRPHLPRALGDLPIPAAEARRMSREDEARGRGGYRDDAAVGRTGRYFVDLKDIRGRPSWTLASVAHHELVPGHILQGRLQADARPHPLRLRYSGAYAEGWATYAERLAGELGVYRQDPAGEIGALQWRLFRVARIVADTGLGALGWSRDQAEAAMRDLQGQSIAFITIEADVQRMSETPGAAAAQGLMALEIVRLRGPSPEAPAFHRAVLSDGPWPLDALEQRVRMRPS